MSDEFDDSVVLPDCDIVLNGETLFAVYNRYHDPFQIAIDLYSRDEQGIVECYCHVTINHPKYDKTLTDDVILVRDYGFNKDLPQALVDAGIIGGKQVDLPPNLYAAFPLLKKLVS